MIPQYIRFYGSSKQSTLNEYARVFFALCNSMYKIKATEILDKAKSQSIANGNESLLNSVLEQQKGQDAIVEQVKVVKKVINV